MNSQDSFQGEEFEQSIQIHLEELNRKEKELQQEENALRLEKATRRELQGWTVSCSCWSKLVIQSWKISL